MRLCKFLLVIILTATFAVLNSGICTADNLSQQASKYPVEKIYKTALVKHLPFFLIFYAQWCAESNQYLPVINQLETVWGNRVIFIKVDVEDSANAEFLENFKKVKYLPQTRVFNKKGESIQEFTGAKGKDFLESVLKEITR